MTEQKTFKQLLQEFYPFETDKLKVKELIKQFLTQKLQELTTKKTYNYFGVIIDIYIEKELLRDL